MDSLQNEKSISVVTDQFNNPTLAEDLAAGSELVIKKAAVGLYHLAGKDYINRFDFASTIAKTFDLNSVLIKPIKSTQLKQLALRPQLGGLKIDMAQEKLAYNPKSLTESLLYLKQKIMQNE